MVFILTGMSAHPMPGPGGGEGAGGQVFPVNAEPQVGTDRR